MTDNPLLDLYRAAEQHLKVCEKFPAEFSRNRYFRQPMFSGCLWCRDYREDDPRLQYAFAVPDDRALDAIKAISPRGVVEIGAGRGYWAGLLAERGVDVVAYDKNPPGQDNFWFKDATAFFDVQKGTPQSINKALSRRTLLLCWPYMDSMAVEAAQEYRYRGGQTLVYIGEGHGGCTADDAFFKELSLFWTLADEIPIPQWDGLHDELQVYTRPTTN